MGRKVVVTGGAGFIGSNLVQALVSEGFQVFVIDDLSSGHSNNLASLPQVTLVQESILDKRVVNEIVDGADTVFHLAASVGNQRSIDNPIHDAQVNAIGTIRLLEACRASGVRKLVYSSSAGIFGELKTVPVSEDHPIEPESPYGASKLAGEKAALSYAALYDLEVVALRYFNVYGPNQRYDAYGNVIPIFVFRMLNGEPVEIFGDGEQTRDFIHVRDVVHANINAAKARGVSGAFNIGSGTRITITRLAQLAASFIDEACDIRYTAPRPGDVRHSLADIDKAREQLGFEPSVDIELGLKEYVAWARAHAVNSS